MKLLPSALRSFVATAVLAAGALAQDLDLKSEVDRSLHWLRAEQDEATGRYGAGIADTAWALRAFAASPRAYRRSDGPFVERALDYLIGLQRADGSIAEGEAQGHDALGSTQTAAGALSFFPDPTTRPALGRALEFVGKHVREDMGLTGEMQEWEDLPRFTSAEAAQTFARELVAKRGADGAWEGPRGRVFQTARHVVELSLASKATSSAAARKVAEPLPRFEPAELARIDAALERGARYLVGVADQGRFGKPGEPDPGMTAMAVGALQALPEPRPEDVQRTIDAGLAWLVSLQRPDGSIHAGGLANYVTSAAILALARSSVAEHRAAVVKARDFLIELQADEGEHYSPDDPHYGGIGYGGDERPDLSNLQMSLEALVAAGVEHDDPAFARALAFLQRCQNRSETNDVRIVDGERTTLSGDDGGSAYAPGDSPAGFVELEGGKRVPRSYGSMTYALLKSYILAGLPKEDPRMQAAWKWLREHYTLDVNPGFEAADDPTAAYQGLFYYFLTMAKALELYGEDVVVDGAGHENRWRSQLAGRLVAMQRKTDGSWINQNSSRWWEGNPVLATSYALLTLGITRG